MNDAFSLEDKRAVVVGGTRGIGRAIAWRLAQAGASVVANYVRDQVSADRLAHDAAAAGLSIELCRADVTNPKGVETLIEAVAARWGGLSILVYAAATGVHKPAAELTLRHFDWTFALNVRAFFDVVKQLLSRFEPDSSVVAVSSEGAVRAVEQYTMVGASKGASEAMVRHLAAELASRGIRVNAISPGAVATDAWRVLPDGERRLSEAARRVPRGRLTTAEEVAWATQFLCSAAASGIAGHALVVDGGARVVGTS